MPYKVIQTLEKGKPELTAVPHAWERDGTLFWPKYNAEKLLKIEDTYPEGNWITIPCVVKKYNINSYEKAQTEIRFMLYQSEMDAEEEQKIKKRQTAVLATLNDLAKQCMMMSAPGDASAADINNETMSNDLYFLNSSTYKQTPGLISTTSDQVLENQKMIMENQQKIMLKLDEFSMRLEQLIAKNKDPIQSDNVTMEHNSIFSVIDNLDALEKFEHDLKDVNKKKALFKKYSIVCKGKGVGLNCAYVLIDILFSRKFLTKCSWAGGSRGEESKVAFKAFKNTIDFFYNLVYDCDQSFSLMDCYAFFKNILKNSVKRNESKCLRTSSCKNRPRMKRNIEKQRNPLMDERECGGEEYEDTQYNMVKNRSARASSSKRAPKGKRNIETSESESNTEKDDIRNEQISTSKLKKIKKEIQEFEFSIEKVDVIGPDDKEDSFDSSE